LSTALRAAASAVKLATVAPVTNPTALSRGQVQHLEEPASRDFFDARHAGVGPS
jgi:hypothetical protein